MTSLVRNGDDGGLFATSAQGAITGNFACIEIMEDSTTFTVFTNAGYTRGKDPTTITFNRGDRIWGTTTAFTVSAGLVHAIDRI
jgi:hypothetical protein